MKFVTILESKVFDLMSIEDFAKEIKTPKSTINTWRRRENIPHSCFKKIGGTVFVRVEAFKLWLENVA